MSLANLLKKGSLQQVATATVATVATHEGLHSPTVAEVATVAVANAQNPAAADPPTDHPDRWCWPHSTAMTGREIDLFTKRVDLFFYRNLPLPDAESLADKLVKRDRDGDDRRVCLECKHMADIGHGWRCNNWQAAGVAVRQRDNQIPADLVLQLQRCDGFAETTLTVYTF